MPFKPQVHECKLEDGGEEMVFYVREPSGREILGSATKRGQKEEEKSAIDNARDLFAKYVVHEDGTPIEKNEVEEFLDMRLVAMHKMSLMVQDKIGLRDLTKKVEGEEGKA